MNTTTRIAVGAAAGVGLTLTALTATAGAVPAMGVRWQVNPAGIAVAPTCNIDGDPAITLEQPVGLGGLPDSDPAPYVRVDLTGPDCGSDDVQVVLYATRDLFHDGAQVQHLIGGLAHNDNPTFAEGFVGFYPPAWDGLCGLQIDVIARQLPNPPFTDGQPPAELLGTPFTDAGVLADSWNGPAGPLTVDDCQPGVTTTTTSTPSTTRPTTTTTQPTTTTSTEPPVTVTVVDRFPPNTTQPPLTFENCEAAANAGLTDFGADTPGFGPHLDLDGDGIACETTADVSTTTPDTVVYTGGSLPVTGGNAGVTLAVGGSLLAAGLAALSTPRLRNRRRLTA